jgi:hypothetical protein
MIVWEGLARLVVSATGQGDFGLGAGRCGLISRKPLRSNGGPRLPKPTKRS